jgi:hypothetical protein
MSTDRNDSLQPTISQITLTAAFLFDRVDMKALLGGEITPEHITGARIGSHGDLVLTIRGRADPARVTFGEDAA